MINIYKNINKTRIFHFCFTSFLVINYSCESEKSETSCNKLLDIYANASVDYYEEENPEKGQCVSFYNSYINAYDGGCVDTDFTENELSQMRNGIYCDDVYCDQLKQIYNQASSSFMVNYNEDSATVDECNSVYGGLLGWIDAGCDSMDNSGFTESQLDSMRDETYCFSLLGNENINEQNILGTWNLVTRTEIITDNEESVPLDTLVANEIDTYYSLIFEENGTYNYTGQIDSESLNGSGTWSSTNTGLILDGNRLYNSDALYFTTYSGFLSDEGQTLSLSYIDNGTGFTSAFDKVSTY